MSVKGVEVSIPPLVLVENSELECWENFLLRFEIALINTNLAINDPTNAEEIAKKESSSGSSSKSALSSEEIKESNEYKRGGLLLNSIGEEGYRIFTKWNLRATDIKYTDLVGRYRAQFEKKQNLFVIRHKFFTMEQMSSENVDVFVDRVVKSASYCKFAALEDDMALQVITKGLRDDKLRKELLCTEAIDMTKAKNLCSIYMSAEKSNTILTGSNDNNEVALVKQEHKGGKAKKKKEGGACFICKSTEHWANKCPHRERNVTCHQCKKKGHYARNCPDKEKKVREVTTETKTDEPYEFDESY